MSTLLRENLESVPLFENVDHDKLLEVLQNSEIVEYKAGEYICKEGEYHENCSVMLSGMASVILPAKGAGSEEKITLKAGELFGEIAALSGNPRTADIVALKSAVLLNIPRRQMFKMLDKFPKIKAKVDGLYKRRALRSHLLSVEIFGGIKAEVIEDLSDRVTLHTFNKDDVIFREGEEADAFYMVRYGFVKVYQNSKGSEKVVAYLKEGSYFGEIAIVGEDIKRTASISAITRLELIKISKVDFQAFIEAHPWVKNNFKEVIERRKKRNIQIDKSAYLSSALDGAIESGIIQTKAVLIMDISKCVQCDNCVDTCAALHNGTSRLIRSGTRFSNFLFVPTSCRHCEDPTCMTKCPTGAITRDVEGEIYHQDFCIGCGACAKRCPYGNITIVKLGETSANGNNKGIISRLFSRFSSGSDSAGGSKEGGKFIFKGDRDQVVRSAENKLAGDRDMFSVNDDGSKKKKSTKLQKKATKCDMCRDYPYMGCVYNCPTGAARRVNPTEFFSDIASIG